MGENFDGFQVRTLSNLDRILTPYYRADLAAGRTTEAEFRDQLRHFWWQWGSIDNYFGQPVYFGGTKADGTTEYNEVSRILLEVHDELGLPTPKVHIKTGPSTPDWVWRTTLDLARRQRSVTFCGEEPLARAITGLGYTAEQARTCAIWGCYEWGIRDSCNDTIPSYVNALKPVEKLLARARIGRPRLPRLPRRLPPAARGLHPRGARARVRDGEVGARGQPLHALLPLHRAQRQDRTRRLPRRHGARQQLPHPDGRHRLRRRFAPRRGGPRLQGAPPHPSRTRTGDGRELERTRGAPRTRPPLEAQNIPNSRGGRFVAGGHSSRRFVDFGKRTGATPDGRKKGEEMSKNLSPAPGADTEGVTALIRTLAALDPADLPMDMPLDVMLHPSAVAGDKGLDVMRALVEEYHASGLTLIQFNVFDAATLRDAQAHPRNYENLQVRICGWNVRWNDLPREQQDAYIRRAEAIARP